MIEIGRLPFRCKVWYQNRYQSAINAFYLNYMDYYAYLAHFNK